MEITEEFYQKVDKVAKSTAYKWTDLDWEDIRQDMWVWMLDNPNEYTKLMEDDWDTRDKKLRKIGSQVAVAEVHGYEQYSGQYIYGTDEVRGWLRENIILKSDDSVISERLDLSLAMMELNETNKSYFSVIIDRYVHERELNGAERKRLTLAVEKLTLLMNQIHNFNEYTYEDGPGARKVLSNSTSVAITGSWE